MQSLTRFKRYRLEGILPAEDLLVLDPQLKLCTRIQGAFFVEQVHMTDFEFAMLSALCEMHPLGCSYEKAVSVRERISEEEATLRLLNALSDEGTAEKVIHPVRSIMTRLRESIFPLGIDIGSGKEGKYSFQLPQNTLLARLQTKVQELDDQTHSSIDTRRRGHRQKKVS